MPRTSYIGYLLLSAVAGGACVRACVCMGVRESTRQPLVCISIFGYGRDGAQRPSSNPLRFPDAHQWFTVTGFALAVLFAMFGLFARPAQRATVVAAGPPLTGLRRAPSAAGPTARLAGAASEWPLRVLHAGKW